MPRIVFPVGLMCVYCIWAGTPIQAASPDLAPYLETGKLSAGISGFEKHLIKNGDDQQARFGLGVLQFLQAVEGLAQDHYRFGLLAERANDVPLLRLPVPANKNPEQISYQKARQSLQDFVDGLAAAEKTLSRVDTSDVKLPIHFGRIRLDLNGDGQADESERFWKIYASFNRRVNEENGKKFAIAFDGGDVHWLRGYCHLLMGMGEFILAHDWEDLFERTAHVVYPKVQSDHALLQAEGNNDWSIFLLDAIAFIHLINFDVVAPEQLKSALAHLDEMTVQSRLSWKRIRAESDNDREWLPNPAQAGVIPNVQITEEMISSWEETMAEMQAIFRGKKLLPYWRGAGADVGFGDVTWNPTVGINLQRAFTEPTRLDLVLWVQGTAATPYLESYEQTGKPPVDGEVFDRMVRVFEGEFIGFALWFN